MIQLIDCPRDAMQGIKEFIPTEKKIALINQLLRVGFHTLDFGSFVSEKAIPQLKDTHQVLTGLDLENTNTKLLAIVANTRGAEAACEYDEIDYVGFPFSISETFQQRNTHSSISESFDRVKEIQDLCMRSRKQLVVYISMGFGNPYGDLYSPHIAAAWSERLNQEIGVETIALSDTIGIATPELISDLFSTLIPAMPNVTFGAHLHTTPDTWHEKIEAAFLAGCKRYDGALLGFGGCPMAEDKLTGNMPTEHLIDYFEEKDLLYGIQKEPLQKAIQLSTEIYHV